MLCLQTPVVDEDGVFDMEKEGEEGEGRGTGETEEDEEEEESESDDDDVQIVIGPIENPPAPFYQGRLPSTSSESELYLLYQISNSYVTVIGIICEKILVPGCNDNVL